MTLFTVQNQSLNSEAERVVWTVTSSLSGAAADEVMSFIRGEQRKGRESIGWVPWSGVERTHANGRIAVLTKHSTIVGFVMFGPSKTSCKVFQAWVRKDLREITHGRQLICGLKFWSLMRGLVRIKLWCADDLPSNYFWQAIGCEKIGERNRSKKRVRPQTCYVVSTAISEQEHRSAPVVQLASQPLHNLRPSPIGAGVANQRVRQSQLTICDPL